METKKLTCCDLMIGDYVYSTFSEKPCKVQAIELSEHGYGSVRVAGVDGVKDIVSLSPIPLTAKVLDMNFERKVYNDYAYYELDDNFCVRIVYGEMFLARWDDDELSVYQSPHAILRLNYAHELQHAMRLCGVDKEIIL